MKLISWNVNGFRSCLKKGFEAFFSAENADIFCLQETKMQPGEADFSPEGYTAFYSSAIKKGYSGTAVFTRTEPLSCSYGIDGRYSDEGRLITLEYDGFYLICCYAPNSQRDLARLPYRLDFNDLLRSYMKGLSEKKPVILCGDMNVAHNEIDLKNAKSNVGNACFTNEERQKFTELLESGFVDSYRFFYPERTGAYTWWSYVQCKVEQCRLATRLFCGFRSLDSVPRRRAYLSRYYRKRSLPGGAYYKNKYITAKALCLF